MKTKVNKIITSRANAADLYASRQIKRLRFVRGMKIEDVAKALRVSVTQAKNWERGKNRLWLGKIMEYAELFRVPAIMFFPPDAPGIDEDSLRKDFNQSLYLLAESVDALVSLQLSAVKSLGWDHPAVKQADEILKRHAEDSRRK